MRSVLVAIVIICASIASTGAIASSWRLRPDGYGPIRYGMTLAQVHKVVGRLESEGTPDCPLYRPTKHPEIQLLFDPVSKRLLGAGSLSVQTVDGISSGVDASMLERLYPGQIKKTQDGNESAAGPDNYFAVADVDQRANRQWGFTVENGKVTAVGSGYVDAVPACED